MEINREKYLKQVKYEVNLSKVNTNEQALVLEMFHFFLKKIPFGHLMKTVKRVGIQKVYEAFNSVRKSTTCQNPPGMFLYLCKKK